MRIGNHPPGKNAVTVLSAGCDVGNTFGYHVAHRISNPVCTVVDHGNLDS
jgi:hypothetical protein